MNPYADLYAALLDGVKRNIAGERNLTADEMQMFNEQLVTCALLADAWNTDAPTMSLPDWIARRDAVLGVTVAV